MRGTPRVRSSIDPGPVVPTLFPPPSLSASFIVYPHSVSAASYAFVLVEPSRTFAIATIPAARA
jgi:hypothetical protein